MDIGTVSHSCVLGCRRSEISTKSVQLQAILHSLWQLAGTPSSPFEKLLGIDTFLSDLISRCFSRHVYSFLLLDNKII